MRARKILTGTGIGFVAIAALYLAGPRYQVREDFTLPTLPVTSLKDLEAAITAREATVPHLRPGLAARFEWRQPNNPQPTEWAFVFIHGFSASPKEISPVPETIAQRLGANAYFARLTGHGQGDELADAQVGDWLRDAEEAYEIGRRIGKHVFILSASTGSTLSTWLALRHPDIAGLGFLSPNLALRDPRAHLVLGPWGNRIAHLVSGDRRGWVTENPLQELYWTNHHPIESVYPLVALVEKVKKIPLQEIHVPVLFAWSPKDDTLDTDAIVRAEERWGSDKKQIFRMDRARGHVLAGDACSPETNQEVEDMIVNFAQSLAPTH